MNKDQAKASESKLLEKRQELVQFRLGDHYGPQSGIRPWWRRSSQRVPVKGNGLVADLSRAGPYLCLDFAMISQQAEPPHVW